MTYLDGGVVNWSLFKCREILKVQNTYLEKMDRKRKIDQ